MRRLMLAVLVPLLAMPGLALAHGAPHRPFRPVYQAPDTPVLQVVRGVAMEDATADSLKVVLTAKSRWRAPWGVVKTLRLGPTTRFLGKASAFGDVKKGDRVQVAVLAPRRVSIDQVAADTVVDLGACAVPASGNAPWLGRPVWFLARGRVTATADGSFTIRARAANRAAFRAMWRARTRTVTVRLDAQTVIRVAGQAANGTAADIGVGDVVRVRWYAPRGTALAALPAAQKVRVLF